MPLHTGTELVIETPEQLKALSHTTRAAILRILEDRPASSKELSELLEMSHGKIGHHVRVLREGGFIRVVEERQVRALTEKVYGLTYDRMTFGVGGADRLGFVFGQAAREALPSSQQPFDPPGTLITARMSIERADALHARMVELAGDFQAAAEEGGEAVFGFAGAVFLTDTPPRPRP